MKKVIIDIYTDGSSKIDAEGFKGTQCSLATREIEIALSGGDNSAVSDKKKPDFYGTHGNTTQQTNG